MDWKRLLLAISVLASIATLVVVLANFSDPEVDASGTGSTTTDVSLTSTTAATTSSTLETTTTVTSTSTTSIAPAATTSAPTTTPSSRAPITTTTTTPASAPAFQSAIGTVTANDLHASWRSGCPLDVDELRAVDVSYWGYDGEVHSGRLIVAATLAEQMVAIMHDLYDARYPIQRMEPVDAYGGDDDQSMAANNTSAFNCRPVTGGSAWSEHSYGRAIDINPLVNPYVRGSTVLPPGGAAYTDRNQDAPGMIHGGDEVVDAFAARGWEWGGYWGSPKDYQHFSTTGH